MSSPDTSITAAVVEFASRARLDAFPSEALRIGKRCLIDGLGVMLAGSTTPAGRAVADFARSLGGTPESSAIGVDGKVPASAAALVNGTAGHALDWDDTQLSNSPDRIFGLLTHPTVPPMAAAFAVGERLGRSGGCVLEAFLTGFEVECKIAEAISPMHYRGGFHSSGTIGTFGAAVATAKLLALDADALGRAIGIAASMASGIRVNFGTMTKPLHVGRAAQNGLTAAELAARGFTADPAALDGPWGFFQVLGRDVDRGKIVGQLGNPHTIVAPGVSIKPYPCGVLGHPSMDAMLTLVVTHDIKPEDIRAIRIRAGSNILNPLRYPIAQNELEAKFCPAFMLSAIAIRRRAGIHEFADEFVQSAPVQALMAKVERVLDPAIEAKGVDKIRSTIEVQLQDGRWLSQAADERYRGGPDHPLTDEELHAKFSECASLVLDGSRIEQVLGLLTAFEMVDDVRRVTAGMAR